MCVWLECPFIPCVCALLLSQVLLSIQSLILVDEPYFNEPGFESHPHARRQCEEYNQSLRYVVSSGFERWVR